MSPLDIISIAHCEAYRRDALDHPPAKGWGDEAGQASYLWYLGRCVERLSRPPSDAPGAQAEPGLELSEGANGPAQGTHPTS